VSFLTRLLNVAYGVRWSVEPRHARSGEAPTGAPLLEKGEGTLSFLERAAHDDEALQAWSACRADARVPDAAPSHEGQTHAQLPPGEAAQRRWYTAGV